MVAKLSLLPGQPPVPLREWPSIFRQVLPSTKFLVGPGERQGPPRRESAGLFLRDCHRQSRWVRNRDRRCYFELPERLIHRRCLRHKSRFFSRLLIRQSPARGGGPFGSRPSEKSVEIGR